MHTVSSEKMNWEIMLFNYLNKRILRRSIYTGNWIWLAISKYILNIILLWIQCFDILIGQNIPGIAVENIMNLLRIIKNLKIIENNFKFNQLIHLIFLHKS